MRDDLFFTLEKDFDTCENMEHTCFIYETARQGEQVPTFELLDISENIEHRYVFYETEAMAPYVSTG